MFSKPTDHEEISTIIKNFKNSSAGYDNILPRVIRDTVVPILNPLIHIINLSLTEGYFPKQIKAAKVVPIFKGGDPMLVNNYRPVSVLPAFS